MADDFTRRQFRWLDQVLSDPKLSHAAFVLAYRISKFFNRDTGDAWPAQPTLAAAMRMNVRSIRSLTDQLERAGHLLVIASRGRGHSCRYSPIVHAEPGQPEPEPEPKGEASAALVAEPQERELFPIKVEAAPRPASRAIEDLTADFEGWWLQYPRKVSKGAAAKAYGRARKGATADELQMGAMRYAAVRTGQDPKFTKHAATWLNNGCWMDEPEHQGPPTGERSAPQLQRHAPMSHLENALAGLSRDD